jgi:hypothetical protein
VRDASNQNIEKDIESRSCIIIDGVVVNGTKGSRARGTSSNGKETYKESLLH